MTNQHPITPPPELVQQWCNDSTMSGVHYNERFWTYEQRIATAAAQWGSDQELEACVAWLDGYEREGWAAQELRTARRPIRDIVNEYVDAFSRLYEPNALTTIRRALEALDD